MNEDFVTYELAKKLKEKGFNCELPYAMYNEIGQFCLLTTSAPYHVCESCYKYREYYDYNDFDKNDFIAPTISQVLKWLRQEKKILVEIALSPEGYRHIIYTGLCCTNTSSASYYSFDGFYNHENNYMTYEQAALSGIEYVIDNLI